VRGWCGIPQVRNGRQTGAVRAVGQTSWRSRGTLPVSPQLNRRSASAATNNPLYTGLVHVVIPKHSLETIGPIRRAALSSNTLYYRVIVSILYTLQVGYVSTETRHRVFDVNAQIELAY